MTLRLCSAPMKSQVNASGPAACLASSAWARFSPTSRTPACARTAEQLGAQVLDRHEHLHLVRAPGRRRRSARRRCAGWRARPPDRAPRSAAPHHARLAAGEAVVAPMGEEQLRARRRWCTGRSRGPRSRPAAASWRRATALRSRCRPRRTSGPSAGERRVHVLGDLVAARTGTGPDAPPRAASARRRAPRTAATPRADDAAGQPPPAAVEHPDRAAAGDRHRQAVGGEHHRRDPRCGGEHPVGLGRLALGRRRSTRSRTSVPCTWRT